MTRLSFTCIRVIYDLVYHAYFTFKFTKTKKGSMLEIYTYAIKTLLFKGQQAGSSDAFRVA